MDGEAPKDPCVVGLDELAEEFLDPELVEGLDQLSLIVRVTPKDVVVLVRVSGPTALRIVILLGTFLFGVWKLLAPG